MLQPTKFGSGGRIFHAVCENAGDLTNRRFCCIIEEKTDGYNKMNHMNLLFEAATPLLYWYAASARDLPWRRDCDPYHIWISEIMLQQTRAEAVKPYFSAFLEAFPTPEALALADDDVLNKIWQGLGYYSRVRNLKKAADSCRRSTC